MPDALKTGPFTIAQAERAGVGRQQLRGAGYRRMTRGVYQWAELGAGPLSRLQALAPRLRPGCAFSGVTAALVHGLDVPFEEPIEATVPHGLQVTPRADLRVRHGRFRPGDIVQREGLSVTSPVRTVFDLARRLSVTEAVVMVDMALHRRLISLVEIQQYVQTQGRVWGVPRARRAIDLADGGAQSPMESRLRMLLLLRSLPRPQVQMPICDEHGFLIGYADMGYPHARLGIEYDGGTHRTSLVADDRRQNRIQLAGTLLLRFTAPDIHHRPDEIAHEVRAALLR